MATVASQTGAANARPSPLADGQGSKRGKAKKAADPVNTTKQIEETIAQLERNRAGDKEQDLEIEREVKKANRDLSHLLSTMEAPMSRLETVQRKYTELLADMKRTEREHVKSKKKAEQLQKDKDTTRSDLTKMTAAKDKLEKLCREMQKDNKKLKDDNKRLSETETRMREELHERLEGMVLDVQDLIEQRENPESIPANMESDQLFKQKFKSFIDQYELRELQFYSLLRTKELEVQYQGARYEQQRKAQEQEATKSRQLTTQVSTFSQTETELRSQLNIYVDKFKQVEDTLNNSNDLFLTFRREMEEMSKKTKRLEKENHTLTRKHDLTAHNILTMAEDRTNTQHELDALRKKNENLEKLCRGMQAQGRGGSATLPSPSSTPGPGGALNGRSVTGPPQAGSAARLTNGNTSNAPSHHHHHHPHPHPRAHPYTNTPQSSSALPGLDPDSTTSSPTTDSDYDDYNEGLDEDDNALDEEDDDDYDEDDTEEEAALLQASAGQSLPPPSQALSSGTNAPPPPPSPARQQSVDGSGTGGGSTAVYGPSPPPLPAPLQASSSRSNVNGQAGPGVAVQSGQKVVNGRRH